MPPRSKPPVFYDDVEDEPDIDPEDDDAPEPVIDEYEDVDFREDEDQ